MRYSPGHRRLDLRPDRSGERGRGRHEGVPRFIIERQLGHFDKVDREYGDGVRAALAAAGPAFGGAGCWRLMGHHAAGSVDRAGRFQSRRGASAPRFIWRQKADLPRELKRIHKPNRSIRSATGAGAFSEDICPQKRSKCEPGSSLEYTEGRVTFWYGLGT